MRCLLILLLAGAASASSSLLLFDAKDAAYLVAGVKEVELQQAHIGDLVAAVTGLVPDDRIGEGLSHALASVVKASALKKPSAYAVFNVAGLKPAVVEELFAGRLQRRVGVAGDKCPMTASVDALAALAAANPTASLVVLDQHGLQDCSDACLQQHLAESAAACNMQHTPADTPLRGQAVLPNGAALDFSKTADRMFAVELASFSAGLKAQLQALAKRAEELVPQEDIELFEVSFMALHALAGAHGPESPQVEGAAQAIVKALALAVDGLDAAFHGNVVYQVAMSDGPVGGSMKTLTDWKDRTRRHLLSATRTLSSTSSTWPPADPVAAAKTFSSKAAAYGAFILLLYFSLAAMHCMCNMPFKTDTLLFPGDKKGQ